MSGAKTFSTGATVRLSGEGKYESYTVEEGGTFKECDRVRLRPIGDYLQTACAYRMGADGCITALACFVESRIDV